MPTAARPTTKTPSQLIDARIETLGDWRGAMLGRLRAVITTADKGIVEEWKWGVPVWSHDGIVCTGETYKTAVKLTFAHGAALKDPKKLFNSSLAGGTRRAIDFHEGDVVDEVGLQGLIRDAAALNMARTAARGAKPKARAANVTTKAKVKAKTTTKAKTKAKAKAKAKTKTKTSAKTRR